MARSHVALVLFSLLATAANLPVHAAPDNAPAGAAATSQPIMPDPAALAQHYGPFRNDASRGIPAGVRARPMPANNWLAPKQREPEKATNAVLVKVHSAQSRALAGKALAAQAETPDEIVNRVLGKGAVKGVQKVLQLKTSAAKNATGRLARIREEVAAHVTEKGLDRWHRVQLAGITAEEAVNLLKKDDAVELAEPEYIFRPADLEIPDATTDPLLADQWHLDDARVKESWEYLKSLGMPPGGSRDVVVAVIDTGVDYTHPDLAANMWVNALEVADGQDSDGNGYVDDIHGVDTTTDVASKRGNPQDDNGHGTHVAGIIAAQGRNGQGGVGVAYNVRIMAIKAAQYSGVLAASQVAAGVYYAVENGADVINMSFGGYGKSTVLEDALSIAFGQAVLVAAAGNDGKPNASECDKNNWGAMYPAAYNWVLGVMAQQRFPSSNGDWLASFSNWDCTPGDLVEYEVMLLEWAFGAHYRMLPTVPGREPPWRLRWCPELPPCCALAGRTRIRIHHVLSWGNSPARQRFGRVERIRLQRISSISAPWMRWPPSPT